MGKGIFAWVKPVMGTNEQELIHLIGLDATVFLRFTRMCRNLCLLLTIIGCGILVPTYLVKGVYDSSWSVSWLSKLTPANVSPSATWAQVACAWFFDIAIALILWWNYRAMLRLRRQYFDSAEYHNSLHARTLMVSPSALAYIATCSDIVNRSTIFPNPQGQMKELAELSTR